MDINHHTYFVAGQERYRAITSAYVLIKRIYGYAN